VPVTEGRVVRDPDTVTEDVFEAVMVIELECECRDVPDGELDLEAVRVAV
jgi:hypothetical protein